MTVAIDADGDDHVHVAGAADPAVCVAAADRPATRAVVPATPADAGALASAAAGDSHAAVPGRHGTLPEHGGRDRCSH